MPGNVATVGSSGVGVCTGHDEPIAITFVVMTGNKKFSVNGKDLACAGTSIIMASCGHSGFVFDGSATFTTDQGAVARVGSTIVGPTLTGIIELGDPSIFIGD